MPQVFEMLLILLLVVFLIFSFTVDRFTPYRFIGEMEDPRAVRIELVEIIDGYFTYGDEQDLDQKLRRVAVIEDNETFIKELKRLNNSHPFGDPAYLGADGKAIMLTYPNGNIELIGIYGTTWIADGGMEIYYSRFDEESYLAFWEKWAEMTDAVPA